MTLPFISRISDAEHARVGEPDNCVGSVSMCPRVLLLCPYEHQVQGTGGEAGGAPVTREHRPLIGPEWSRDQRAPAGSSQLATGSQVVKMAGAELSGHWQPSHSSSRHLYLAWLPVIPAQTFHDKRYSGWLVWVSDMGDPGHLRQREWASPHVTHGCCAGQMNDPLTLIPNTSE